MAPLWLFASMLVAVLAATRSGADDSKWWRNGIIYQIYPRSFKDSNGDGIGDLKGIEEKLDYLKDLGVDAIWLTAIFPSPMVDFGYDVSDMTDVDPIFGSLEDFDDLRRTTAEMDIKLMLDFVPNHTSDRHQWFLNSQLMIEPYTDYYVWSDGVNNRNQSRPDPPNNWVSVYGGTAWAWSEVRGQFYLHQFFKEQPDLNLRNPAVAEEMMEVLMFWLDHGVDGFRVGDVSYLFEDADLRDEPTLRNPFKNYSSLEHIHTKDQPESYQQLQEWREFLDLYSAEQGRRVLLACEVYTDMMPAFGYYGNTTTPGCHLPLNYQLFRGVNGTSSAEKFAAVVNQWMDNLPDGRHTNWMTGSYDTQRVASRFKPELVDAMNMLALLLPGTTVTYNGEEIGMEDTFIPWSLSLDPLGIYSGQDGYQRSSRDPERTPFQWDNTTSAGFSTNSKTWLPVNWNYELLNLDAQKEEEQSHYRNYKRLVLAKHLPTIQFGSLSIQGDEMILVFVRELAGYETIVVLINFGLDTEDIDLTDVTDLSDKLSVYAASLQSSHRIDDYLPSNNVTLLPKASLVLIDSWYDIGDTSDDVTEEIGVSSWSPEPLNSDVMDSTTPTEEPQPSGVSPGKESFTTPDLEPTASTTDAVFQYDTIDSYEDEIEEDRYHDGREEAPSTLPTPQDDDDEEGVEETSAEDVGDDDGMPPASPESDGDRANEFPEEEDVEENREPVVVREELHEVANEAKEMTLQPTGSQSNMAPPVVLLLTVLNIIIIRLL